MELCISKLYFTCHIRRFVWNMNHLKVHQWLNLLLMRTFKETNLDQGRIRWSQARIWVIQRGNKMSKTKSGFHCKTKNPHPCTHIASEVKKTPFFNMLPSLIIKAFLLRLLCVCQDVDFWFVMDSTFCFYPLWARFVFPVVDSKIWLGILSKFSLTKNKKWHIYPFFSSYAFCDFYYKAT